MATISICPKRAAPFLNYLSAAFEAYPDGGIFFEVIEKHRDSVRANLDKFKGIPGVRSKYEWAAHYHNFVCRDFMKNGVFAYSEDELAAAADEAELLADYLIDERELAVSPRRITLVPRR